MLLPYFDFFSACFVLYRPFNSKLSIPLFCNYARFVQFPFPGGIAVPGFFEIPKDFFTCVREVEVGARRRIFFMSSALAGRRVGGWFGGGSNMEEKKRREKRDRMRIEKSSKTTRNQKRGFFTFLLACFLSKMEKKVFAAYLLGRRTNSRKISKICSRGTREKGEKRREGGGGGGRAWGVLLPQ